MNFQDGRMLLFYWLILIVLYIVEMVLSSLWVPRYLRVGIPIFVRKIPVQRHHQFRFLSKEWAGFVKGNFWHPPLVVKSLDQNEIAFQDKFLSLGIGFGNQKLFRGIIKFDSERMSVTYIGLLSWFEPFYAVGIFWYLGYTWRSYYKFIESIYGDPQEYLIFSIAILLFLRGVSALSHFIVSNQIAKMLVEANAEELAI